MIGSWGTKTTHVPSAVSSLCSVVLLEEMVGTVVLGLHIIFIITWGCANCFLDMLKYMILFICFERACYSLDFCLWKFGKMKVTWKLHSEVLTCILKSDELQLSSKFKPVLFEKEDVRNTLAGQVFSSSIWWILH